MINICLSSLFNQGIKDPGGWDLKNKNIDNDGV